MNDRLPSLADISTSFDEEETSDAESMSMGMTTQSNGAESNVSSSVADEIGKEETKMVHHSRFIMVVVLLIASGICAGGTYVFSINAEFDIFETHVSSSSKIRMTIFQCLYICMMYL